MMVLINSNTFIVSRNPLDDPQDNKQTITDFDKIVFRLPDSRRMDTEALFIDAATKDLYVVTKRENPVYVYQLKYPYSSKDTVTAQEIASLATISNCCR